MKRILTAVFLVLVISVLGCSAVDTVTKVTPTYKTDRTETFYLSYNFSSEASYSNIEINQSELKYTYFDDASGKCADWVRTEPCWGWDDLVTKTYSLSPDEVAKLKDLIKNSGFMGLSSDQLVGTGEQKRYYAYKISVKIGGRQKQVSCQSFPGASVMPRSFLEVKNRLNELVKIKFLLK